MHMCVGIVKVFWLVLAQYVVHVIHMSAHVLHVHGGSIISGSITYSLMLEYNKLNTINCTCNWTEPIVMGARLLLIVMRWWLWKSERWLGTVPR